MAKYWITFRIENDSGYPTRYAAFNKAVDGACPAWWVEPTSFYLIESELDIDELAGKLKVAINPKVDMFLIGMPEFKSARVCGKLDYLDTLRALMPFVKVV